MKQYGLVGRKLGHSFSKSYFSEKFASENLDCEYTNFEIEDISLIDKVLAMNPDLMGFNVTIPYKREIMDFMGRLTPIAQQIGAVNTVKVDRLEDGTLQLTGHNTDCPGFRESLKPMVEGKGIKIGFVLGSGGASHAARVALLQLGITPTVVSRTPRPGQIRYDELPTKLNKEPAVIINATPLGMWPNVDTLAPIPYEMVGPQHVCFDMVYNPHETLFMKKCAERGAIVKNGLEMLHNQAEESWRFWNTELV